MGAFLSKSRRLNDPQWVFPIKDAVRQVVPPEYVERGALEDYNAADDEDEAAIARAIEITSTLRHQNDEPGPSSYPSKQQDGERDRPDTPGKTTLKYYRLFSDWLPRLSLGAAVCMLIMNIFVPGLGTMAFSLKWFSPEDFIIPTTQKQRSAIVLTCLLYGVMQLLLAPFVFGWVWSIATGVLAIQQAKWVAISETYSHVIEHKLKEMLQERMARGRNNNSGPIADVSAHSTSSNGNQGRYSNGDGAGGASTGARFQQQKTNSNGAGSGGGNLNSNNQAMAKAKATTSTPKATPKMQRRSNEVHPTPTPSVDVDGELDIPVFSSRDPSFVADVNGGSSQQQQRLNSGKASVENESSRASSRKSHKSALSLSMNRISPAPTPPAKLSISSEPTVHASASVSSWSALQHQRSVVFADEEPSRSRHASLSRSRDEQATTPRSQQRSQQSKAWGDSGSNGNDGGATNKTVEPKTNYAANHDDDSDDDAVIDIKAATAKPHADDKNNNNKTQVIDDFAIEDI